MIDGGQTSANDIRAVEVGTLYGYAVHAWLDNGKLNIDMEDFLHPEAKEHLHNVVLTTEMMDKLVLAWLAYRMGGQFGTPWSRAAWEAQKAEWNEAAQDNLGALLERLGGGQ